MALLVLFCLRLLLLVFCSYELPGRCSDIRAKRGDSYRPRREGPSARDGHEGPRLRPILLMNFIVAERPSLLLSAFVLASRTSSELQSC